MPCRGTMDPGRMKEQLTHLHIFQAVLLTYAPQDILLAAFLHLSRQQEFIQYEIYLLKIEDNIQLANVAVVFVHLFHVSMDNFEGD